VQQGPDSWTDLLVMNFTSSQVIAGSPIHWDANNKYLHVYGADNATTWDSGYFENITYAGDGKYQANEFSYTLNQNYPNPFNPSTTIQYNVPQRSYVNLSIYNIIGQRVAVLVDGEKDAGFYSVEFNAVNLPSGVYIYRLQSPESVQTRKMILLK
jgi:hypothetical protein